MPFFPQHALLRNLALAALSVSMLPAACAKSGKKAPIADPTGPARIEAATDENDGEMAPDSTSRLRESARDAMPKAAEQNKVSTAPGEASSNQVLLKCQEVAYPPTAFSPCRQYVAGSIGNEYGTTNGTIFDIDTNSKSATLVRQQGRVSAVAYNKSGDRIAIGGWNKEIGIWDAATGQRLQRWRAHDAWIRNVTWSDMGQLMGSSAESTIKIWTLAPTLRADDAIELKGHTDRVSSIAFSPDGRRLVSGSRDNTVRVWDTANGEQLTALNVGGQTPDLLGIEVAFSPDGLWFASGNYDGTINVYDATTFAVTATVKLETGRVQCIAFSSDSTRMASCNVINSIADAETMKPIIAIWDTRSWKTTAIIERPISVGEAGGSNLAFSPDNTRIISSSMNGTIRAWGLHVDTGP